MAKLRFIVVGSGWRSLFYWRIAQALPERFELCAMLCRTEEKAEKMHREYGVPVSTSAEQCAALHPDLVVVAVNKASIAAVSTEWLARGFAVLSETPAALEEDALRALWQLHQQGAKLQVAEQYWLYPTLAKRLAAVHSGALGTPQFARLSVAHGYHAVSLARQFLNAGQQPVRVTGRSWTEKIIETDSRWGAVHNGALVEKTLQQHTLEFAVPLLPAQHPHQCAGRAGRSVRRYPALSGCRRRAGVPSADPAARPAGSCRRTGRA